MDSKHGHGRRPRRAPTIPLAALLLVSAALLGTHALSGRDPLAPAPSAPARAPAAPAFSSALPLNPVIEALVDSVSAERLEESVGTLVGFFTRHTVSDTASPTTGIGAARRWVLDQFEAYSVLNGGSNQAGYFDFIATICNVTRAYRNVLAQQTGTLYPDRFFIVSGHLDDRTVGLCDFTSFAPGANDDASGCAVSLELSYLLGKIETESSMIFMTVVGEDEGLFGSIAYADWALDNGMDIAGMATDDVCGNIDDGAGGQDSTRVRHFSGPPSTSSSRQLARYFKLKGEAYQPGFLVDLIPAIDRPGRSGDHVPFHENGYPAVRFTEAFENLAHQHTADDLPEFMSFPYLARVARVNVAGFASLLLAPKPVSGVLARDAGNGMDVSVSWQAGGEADLAGYRVAYRFETGDSLYYQDIFDAGPATSYTITGLAAGVPVLVSVSAYDQDSNESVFSDEQRVVPASVPVAPSGFQATSRAARIDLDWVPNLELDIQGYELYRSLEPQSGFVLLATLPAAAVHFEDTSVLPGTFYYYRLTARDDKNQEGPPSPTRKGRLVDHALSALLVDATPDGTGNFPPPDARVDNFYAAILSDISVDREWDRADSVVAGAELSDADLGAHRLVVYHTDWRNADVRDDTTHLRKYLLEGGRLLLSGSNLAFTLGGSGEINQPWSPGSFMHDVLRANETRTANDLDCIGASSQVPAYPDLDVDPDKGIFGRLANQDVYIGPPAGGPETEVLYHYVSVQGPPGPNHDKPDAIRVLGGGIQMVAFDIPLYFLDSLSVREAVARALEDLGEGTTGIGGGAGGAGAAAPRFELGAAAPNPAYPAARIPYSTDRRGRVRLRVLDVSGRVARVLVDEVREPGRHEAVWDGRVAGGRPAGSGIYFLELEEIDRGTSGPGRTARRKLVLLR